MEVSQPSTFGTTVFGPPGPINDQFPGDPARNLVGSCAEGRWHPSSCLAPFLRKDFEVPLRCHVAADDLRRITPQCNFEELIDLGANGGRAVIHATRGFDQDTDDYNRLMHLVHQYVFGRRYRGIRGMQEHLTRVFAHSRDLFVRRSGRHADSERNVLPDYIGRTSAGEGDRPSVGQLLSSGREAATKAHYRNPTSQPAIRFGLHEAAKLDPLDVEPEKVFALIEMSLLDVESFGDPPAQELIDVVQRRFWTAVSGHQSDQTEEFYRWFAGAGSSLIKQIAQQKSQPGGKLARENVRRTILHLGVQSLRHIGYCVHALMRSIKLSISPPLNEAEKRLFEHMHECQPYYGNLPAAMLADRMPDLGPAVLTIWDEPDNPEHVGVLHRMLHYYSEMAKRRRQADRQSKNRPQTAAHESILPASGLAATVADAVMDECPPNGTSVTSASKCGPVRFNENLHSQKPAGDVRFATIADFLRRFSNIECPSGCEQWDYHGRSDSPNEVTISFYCECGKIGMTVKMGMDEFIGHGKKALDRP
jgi:hypothetical protein